MTHTSQIRASARDGAMLFFDRQDGAHVLVRGPSTRGLRARAPRVVMFGITNACNLRCGFCSRDLEAQSDWDEESAFTFLAGLAAQGVLEVALGGGEPLAFRGIEPLLARLHRETPLAVHLTTNAVLLDDERLARIRPHVGEIRVSIYDESPWPERIAALARAGGSFGANVLVTPGRLGVLPGLLARLEALGCPDVALLRYVGDDEALALTREELARVGELARGTSMRVRASVCFGDALGVPVLPTEHDGDCGAGGDFLVVTSDRRVRACSFAGDAFPIASAAEAIDAWRRERDRLSAPVALGGCSRDPKPGGRAPPPDGARAWRAFSGNNSGDCFLVGKLERASEAQALVRSLRDGLAPGEPFSEPWRARMRELGVEVGAGEHMPERLAAIGRTVLAHTVSSAEDDFPSLRALVWKLGGRAVAAGIHVHEPVHLVTAIAFDDPRDAEAFSVRAAIDDLGAYVDRGDVLYAMRNLEQPDALDAFVLAHERVAESAVASAELVALEAPPLLAHALAARPPASDVEWLTVRCRDAERAAEFVRDRGENAAAAGRTVILRARSVRPRDGLRAERIGAGARVITGTVVAIDLALWHPTRGTEHPHPIDAATIEADLRAELGPDATLEGPLTERWHTLHGCLHTERPLVVLPFLDAFARGRGLEAWPYVRSPRPLEHAIARLDVDIAALRRERRART